MIASDQTRELEALAGQIIRDGSKSFAAAARLLPREFRASAYLLYAWCRHCDDVIDGQTLGSQHRHDERDSERALAELKENTIHVLEGGSTSDPIFQALQLVCRKHRIPSSLPMDILAGFQLDIEKYRYVSIEDTLQYSYHVAGAVGIVMAMIMGVRDTPTLDRANDLGLAFQLSNIARDVIDDAEVGRVYLPADWLESEGIEPTAESIASSKRRDSIAAVVRRMMIEAEKYYESSFHGLKHLDLRSAWAIASARSIYRSIGRKVVQRGEKAWDRRVSTTKGDKLACVLGGATTALYSHSIARLSESPPRTGLWLRPEIRLA